MAKRLMTDDEKNVHGPGGERKNPEAIKSNWVPFGEQDISHMDAFGDSSTIQPSEEVKSLILAADYGMPELNHVEFARTPSDDDDAVAYELIFDESERPPKPVKHKKEKSKDGKS